MILNTGLECQMTGKRNYSTSIFCMLAYIDKYGLISVKTATRPNLLILFYSVFKA